MRKRRRKKSLGSLILTSATTLLSILCMLLIAIYLNSHWLQNNDAAGDYKKVDYEQPVVSNSNLTKSQAEGNTDDNRIAQEDKNVESSPRQNREEDIPNVCPPFVSKNPETTLSEDYIPKDLKRVSSPTAYEIKKGTSEISEEANQILLEETMLVAEAADALDLLIALAKEDGIELYAYSGYRSYKTQNEVFKRNVSRLGKERAKQVSAIPGQSEHQTGLAMDITSKPLIDAYKKDKSISALQQSLGTQQEGKWLQQNAHKYGFTMSYPEGKEDITGYDYEPWHFFYVGKELAKFLYDTNQLYTEYAIKNCLNGGEIHE